MTSAIWSHENLVYDGKPFRLQHTPFSCMIEAIDIGSSVLQGLVLGILTAFLFKIATNIIKVLIIGQFLLFKWLESREIIIVDWHRLTFGLTKETDLIKQADSLLNSLLETGSFGLAAIIGFLLVQRFSK